MKDPYYQMGDGVVYRSISHARNTKNAPTHVFWMWMFQKKKLTEDANRDIREERMRMLRKHDYKSTSEIIKEPARNNSTLQEVVAKEKEEVSLLREENRTMKEAIDLSLV